jgi:hypothetical protein
MFKIVELGFMCVDFVPIVATQIKLALILPKLFATEVRCTLEIPIAFHFFGKCTLSLLMYKPFPW